AVGAAPYRPANVPFDGEHIVDADEIPDLKRIPRSLAVIGASVIGIEYATIFSALDVKVTVIEPNDGMLGFIDRELIEEFSHDLRDGGVCLRFKSKAARIERVGGACLVRLEDQRQIAAEMVLFAAGRKGAVEALNLEAAGLVADERGRIAVDKASFATAQ